ncbi:MAG: DNA polymerase (family 10) [Candidatus Poriferisodalaceae bacterium]|jgi:DNA polymerase (family 10)
MRDVMAMLSELVTLTTLEEESPQSFKVRAYENARLGLESDGRDVTVMTVNEMTKIKGVGKATASKIRELVDTGQVPKLITLREKFPASYVELSRIPGLGPKTLKTVRQQLGVVDVEGLKAAIAAEQLRTLPGLGKTSEEKIAKAIERLGMSGKDRRTPIADALPLANRLVADLQALDSVVDVKFCGSLRRFSETIGDIDITVASEDPAAVMASVVAHPEAVDLVVNGATKTSFLTSSGLQVDVRVVAPEQFGAAVLYFTGSKAHNIALRRRAINQNMLLNEYGLLNLPDPELDPDGERTVVASATEGEIYAALGLSTVPPPMREGTGEVERAIDGSGEGFGELITRADIRGDLHYHTARSGDGRSTVEEMVAVAAESGYEYLAITDHGVDLAINGSTAEEMMEHREHIAHVQEAYPDLHLMWGCELNIDGSGGLDYDQDFRATFDYTVASVHSHFDQDPLAQTKRLIAAISDPTVDSIGHLSGRYIGRRPGIEFEVDAVLEALMHFDVALEINGALQRLDASSDVVRKAVDRGVKLVINTDSHHTSEMGRMEYGVLTAQRGWAPKDLVINTWERPRFLEWVNSHRML